jgi:hypothetical protein
LDTDVYHAAGNGVDCLENERDQQNLAGYLWRVSWIFFFGPLLFHQPSDFV